MPIEMMATQLLQLVPRFREKIIKEISQEGKDTKGKAVARETTEAALDANVAEVLPTTPIDGKQVPVIIVGINA